MWYACLCVSISSSNQFMLASVLIRARTRRCEPFQLEVWLHFCGALAMALDQGQCPFLRFECAVALPGALDVLRSQGGTFTFDHTQGDWGCFTSRKPVFLSHICPNSVVWSQCTLQQIRVCFEGLCIVGARLP